MYIVDGHCDSILRAAEGDTLVNRYNFSAAHGQLQCVALFCDRAGESEAACLALAERYIAAFKAACAAEGVLPVRERAELETAMACGGRAALLTAEGGMALAPEGAVERLYGAGVRIAGLAWESGPLACSTRRPADTPDTGLTARGHAVLETGNALGMVWDVSHLSDAAFAEVAAGAEKPPCATHSDFRALCPHPRNLTDEQARTVFRRGGMVGLNLYPPFLGDTADRLLAHLDHALALGGEDCIGFGFDIDGIDALPAPLTDMSSLHDQVIGLLEGAHLSPALINKVAGGNWLRFLRENL